MFISKFETLNLKPWNFFIGHSVQKVFVVATIFSFEIIHNFLRFWAPKTRHKEISVYDFNVEKDDFILRNWLTKNGVIY